MLNLPSFHQCSLNSLLERCFSTIGSSQRLGEKASLSLLLLETGGEMFCFYHIIGGWSENLLVPGSLEIN